MSIKNAVAATRSGHGWNRPDVPLSIVPDYVHRREVIIFNYI